MDKSNSITALSGGDDITAQGEQKGFWRRAWEMYRDGFKNLSRTGRQLWLLVLIKLFIMFAILKVFFFHDFLGQKTDGSEAAKSDYVTEQFVNRARD